MLEFTLSRKYTHTQIERNLAMGDTDTCLSLRGLVGFLSSENGCLFPRSRPDLSAAFIFLLLSVGLSHFLLSALLLCVSYILFSTLSLYLCLMFWGFFSSPVSNSDPLTWIWLYACFIRLHVFHFVSLPLESNPSAFHLRPDRWEEREAGG